MATFNHTFTKLQIEGKLGVQSKETYLTEHLFGVLFRIMSSQNYCLQQLSSVYFSQQMVEITG